MSCFDYSTESDFLQVLNEKIQDLQNRVAEKDKYKERYFSTMTENQIKAYCDCGHFIGCDSDGNILESNFCKHRFCSVCNKRYSSKKYAIVKELATSLNREINPKWLFCTLTVKNTPEEDLKKTIDHLMKSINRFFSCKFFKDRVQGFFRSLEITYNAQTNTYHPHYHILLAVPTDYFKNTEIYAQAYEWRKVWERSAKLDYNSQINIKAVQGTDLDSAVAEVAKYAVKLSQVAKFGDIPLKTVAAAIKGRRLISFGGILRPMQRNIQVEHKKDFKEKHTEKALNNEIIRYNFNSLTQKYEILEL